MSISKDNIIVVEDLVKKFGSFVANDHLNFVVKRGEIFGFLGANGAGKTTAIKILCGLSSPTSGKVKVAGYDVYTETEKIKRNIGYMSQRFSLYEDLTVMENIQLFGGIYGLTASQIRAKADELLQKLDLVKVKKKLIASLPLGWKQKLAFSIAIFHDPRIVFLDEPTGGVDPVTRREFWDLIYGASNEGITVFVTTHYMDEAENCNRVCIMSEGKIAGMGSPAEMKADFDALNMDEVFVKIARNIYN